MAKTHFRHYATSTCDVCDDQVVLGTTGWYRCRSCGHESLRDFDPSSLAVASSFSGAVREQRERTAPENVGLVSFSDKS